MSERPIECTQCKRAPSVTYHECQRNVKSTLHMCDECPLLEKRLKGKEESIAAPTKETVTCKRCGTTFEDLKAGWQLGCGECYQHLEIAISQELRSLDCISTRLPAEAPHFHMGNSPTGSTQKELSMQLKELNEALSEALTGEDYEKAAYLRDQISELMDE